MARRSAVPARHGPMDQLNDDKGVVTMGQGKATDAMTGLVFVNRFTRRLPADPQVGGGSRQVSDALFSRVRPTPVKAPQLLAWTPEVAARLDPSGSLQHAAETDPDGMAAILAGNVVTADMDTHATRYGGHQFGNWAGQLGDGRAINLGEIRTTHGDHWTLQLKGAGATPYSRFGDGRAVLRSSVREFLCSEAMHHLGIPTTRALSLVLAGESVVRDMFYDGNPQPEPGAIVCRVAPGFVRFGHFQILTAEGEHELLEQLLEFVIRADWPDFAPTLDQAGSAAQKQQVYLRWFREVCDATQQLVLEWMRVGFVHGVLNTDNMSILGETIDYGPYGWIDNYDPDWTPNTTDAQHRRYRFSQQPVVARWNLYQLANALVPLFDDTDGLQAELERLPASYAAMERDMLANKLGVTPRGAGLDKMLALLEQVLRSVPTDMTLFFRGLMQFRAHDPLSRVQECIKLALYVPDAAAEERQAEERQAGESGLYDEFEAHYRQLVLADNDEERRQQLMAAANPAFILRNYIAQQVIDDLQRGHRGLLDEAMRLMREPYQQLATGQQAWYGRRPDWAMNKAGCSMLSCSS